MPAVPARDPREKILIVRLSHLGDVVHALPVFHALREAAPGAEIAWAVQPESAPLLEGLTGLARTIEFDRRAGFGAWLRIRRELEAFGAGWAIDVQGNAKSALVTLASGAPRRSGWDASDWREPLAAHVLTDPAPPSGARHAVERVLDLARHVAPGSRPGAPRYETDTRRLGAARARLAALPASARPTVLLHLATPGDVRSWPGARFEALARELALEGHALLMLSGPAEAALGAELERQLTGVAGITHEVGQRGLRELAALFTAAAERGARLVSCDSGPMHLAAACGLRVVSLAGPQDPLRTGPWPDAASSETHRTATSAAPPSCAPCLSRRCTHERGPVCMTELSEARVLHALHASFASSPAATEVPPCA